MFCSVGVGVGEGVLSPVPCCALCSEGLSSGKPTREEVAPYEELAAYDWGRFRWGNRSFENIGRCE